MSAYKLSDLIQLWAAGKVTTEQVIGQILQLIQERDQRLKELEGRVHSLRQALDGDSGRRTRRDSGGKKPGSGS